MGTSVNDTWDDVGDSKMGAKGAALVNYAGMETVNNRAYNIDPKADTVENAWRDIEYGLQGFKIAASETVPYNTVFIRQKDSAATSSQAIEKFLSKAHIDIHDIEGQLGLSLCAIKIPYSLSKGQLSDLKNHFEEILNGLAAKEARKKNKLFVAAGDLPKGYEVKIQNKGFFTKTTEVTLTYPRNTAATHAFCDLFTIQNHGDLPEPEKAAEVSSQPTEPKQVPEIVLNVLEPLKRISENLIKAADKGYLDVGFPRGEDDPMSIDSFFKKVAIKDNYGKLIFEIDPALDTANTLIVTRELRNIIRIACSIEKSEPIKLINSQSPITLREGFKVERGENVLFYKAETGPTSLVNGGIKLKCINVTVPTDSFAAKIFGGMKTIYDQIEKSKPATSDEVQVKPAETSQTMSR